MKITTVYASTSGNTELVCEYVQSKLIDKEIQNPLLRVEQVSLKVFNQGDVFIFATSTWEHGEVNPYFHDFLLDLDQQSDDFLLGKKIIFIGLGDTRYEPVNFCKGIDIVEEALLSKGASKISNTLKINGHPHDQLDTIVKTWIEKQLIPAIDEVIK